MERTGIELLGSYGHRWNGLVHFKTSGGRKMIFAGRPKSGQNGVAVISQGSAVNNELDQ